MSDLISRKALIERLGELGWLEPDNNDTEIKLPGIINQMPTAYDVNKVINEIEEIKLNLSRSIMLNSQEYDLDRAVKDAMIPYDNCLKFVKKGGLEE